MCGEMYLSIAQRRPSAVSPQIHFLYNRLQSLNTLVKAVFTGSKINDSQRYFNAQSTQESTKHLQRHSIDGSLTMLSSRA